MVFKKLLIIILFNCLLISIYGQKNSSRENEKIISERNYYTYLFSDEKSTVGNMYNIVYHRFMIEVDPAVKYITATVTTYFIAKEENVQELTFDLTDSLIVDSVVINNTNLFFSHEDNVLSISLLEELSLNQLDSVSVSYHGIPPYGEGFGSFSQGFHDGVPIIWTLSEPYGSKDWWPCKQNLNDKIDSLDIFVKTPLFNKVASNGVLLSVTETDNYAIHHWKHRHPIAAYLIAFAVTNYTAYSEYAEMPNGESLEVLNYVFPESLTTFQTNSPALLEVIEFFSELFIPYPFANEKYGHAQFLWGGGMEHQTMSFVTSSSYRLLVHELAHQWFGDYITCGSWQDIWLNEGFATYLTGLAKEKFYPEDWLDYKISQITQITSQPDGSIFREDTSSVSNIFYYKMTYIKAGMVLHMLRHELGDENFFSGIRNYLNDPEIANNYAKTADLKMHLSNAADTTLDEFFNDWYLGEGYPSYTITWLHNIDAALRFSVEQSQSHESVDFYEMHLPILLVGDNTDSLITVHHTLNNQEFFIDLDFEVKNIVLDPEFNIVKGQTLILNSNLLDVQYSFKIYPNPAQGELKIKSVKYNFIDEILVYDLKGNIIDNLSFIKGTKLAVLNTSMYSSGVHILKIKSGDSFFMQKVIIK